MKANTVATSALALSVAALPLHDGALGMNTTSSTVDTPASVHETSVYSDCTDVADASFPSFDVAIINTPDTTIEDSSDGDRLITREADPDAAAYITGVYSRLNKTTQGFSNALSLEEVVREDGHVRQNVTDSLEQIRVNLNVLIADRYRKGKGVRVLSTSGRAYARDVLAQLETANATMIGAGANITDEREVIHHEFDVALNTSSFLFLNHFGSWPNVAGALNPAWTFAVGAAVFAGVALA